MRCTLKNPARRRYLWRFFATIFAYVVLFALADYFFRRHRISGVLAIMLALGPALAILASIAVVGLYLAEEKDEFQRDLFIRSLLWGIAGTLAFTTVRGFLENFTGVSAFPLYAVYPLFWVIVGLAGGAYEWIYRGRNE